MSRTSSPLMLLRRTAKLKSMNRGGLQRGFTSNSIITVNDGCKLPAIHDFESITDKPLLITKDTIQEPT
jgi:hypothetical protein